MKNEFTIFLTFVCNDEVRRAYICLALKTLFFHCQPKSIPFLVIDGSASEEVKKNKLIFNDVNNLIYVEESESNPFKRSEKHLNLITTPYVLRLLEDAVFLNFSKENFYYIRQDVSLLNSNPEIDVVHYLMVDDKKYFFEDGVLFYCPISFEGKNVIVDGNYKYYNHNENGYIYHYLCNNVLYRTSLFSKQWKYLATNYLTHNDAEAGNINRKLYKMFSDIKYIRGAIRFYYRVFEKIFQKESIIKSAVISQTSLSCDSLHIGYCRVELDESKYSANSNDLELKNLLMFNDVLTVEKMVFKRFRENK